MQSRTGIGRSGSSRRICFPCRPELNVQKHNINYYCMHVTSCDQLESPNISRSCTSRADILPRYGLTRSFASCFSSLINFWYDSRSASATLRCSSVASNGDKVLPFRGALRLARGFLSVGVENKRYLQR